MNTAFHLHSPLHFCLPKVSVAYSRGLILVIKCEGLQDRHNLREERWTVLNVSNIFRDMHAAKVSGAFRWRYLVCQEIRLYLPVSSQAGRTTAGVVYKMSLCHSHHTAIPPASHCANTRTLLPHTCTSSHIHRCTEFSWNGGVQHCCTVPSTGSIATSLLYFQNRL